MNRALALTASFAACSVFGCALIAMSQVPVHKDGKTLVDAKGMTLYTFDRDPRGKSACDAQCAASWPPLIAPAGSKPAGDYTILRRDDGSRQWAYQGKPLYGSTRDVKPGDESGEGAENMWRVARP